MRNNEAYKDETINFDRYLEYMHGQVNELVANYGKLDLLWFDFSYDDMAGEKWRRDASQSGRHSASLLFSQAWPTDGGHSQTTNYNGLFSAMVIIILPPIILYCLFSKFFVEALSGGAVKG